jgi:hypothetical protein
MCSRSGLEWLPCCRGFELLQPETAGRRWGTLSSIKLADPLSQLARVVVRGTGQHARYHRAWADVCSGGIRAHACLAAAHDLHQTACKEDQVARHKCRLAFRLMDCRPLAAHPGQHTSCATEAFHTLSLPWNALDPTLDGSHLPSLTHCSCRRWSSCR